LLERLRVLTGRDRDDDRLETRCLQASLNAGGKQIRCIIVDNDGASRAANESRSSFADRGENIRPNYCFIPGSADPYLDALRSVSGWIYVHPDERRNPRENDKGKSGPRREFLDKTRQNFI